MEVLIQTVTVGFSQVFQPANLLLLFIGVLWGMIFGAIPGLTATMGVALAIPFTFSMKPISGLVLLTGIYIGGVSGGFISATLLNMPGTPSSITTCFDAHPMSKQGKSGLALSLGLFSSFFGGIVGVIFMISLASLIARAALKFGPFEYFSLAVMAFVAVSSMLGGNIVKNLIGIALGLLLSCIGPDPITSIPRLTFRFSELQSGISLLPLLVGLFCMPEIIVDIESEVERIVPKESLGMKLSDVLQAAKILFKQIGNALRSFVVGFIIGVFPGIGGATANIISYGLARSSSKHPEKFGTGIPDGIIASEVSNNASIGGAMVPLLALGIPGDAVTAILLGGFIIHGINPGPLMFKYNPDLVFGVYAAQFWGNVVMLLLGISLMKFYIYSLSFPKQYLLPLITVCAAVGAFGLNNRIFDIWVMLIFGIVGYVLKKLDFPVLPIIIAFVLGPIAESNLRQGLTASAGSFLPIFTRPLSLTLLILAAFLFVLGRILVKKGESARC